jgi:hypothetical protein
MSAPHGHRGLNCNTCDEASWATFVPTAGAVEALRALFGEASGETRNSRSLGSKTCSAELTQTLAHRTRRIRMAAEMR